uniref:Transcription factor JunB n=1 Tax=Sinocyclocheilus anshuiensis TaxID=1608454 RepID=A0A671PWS8_9TELE
LMIFSMNLNLTEPYRNLKSDLYQTSSADMGSLKLASPELERLIIQNSNGVLTTPTPGQYLYGRGITDDHPSTTISYLPPHVQQSQHPENAHAFQHSGVLPQRFVHLKEEPQTVPDMHSSDGSPPMSPIDMENQERIKAERKKLRNRQAATKCRRRKLERIARLEEKVKVLKSDNAGLSSTASVLRDQVAQLKQKVLRHMNSGCQSPPQYQ